MLNPGFHHIGFCKTLERGRVAVWLHVTAIESRARNAFYVAREDLLLSVDGDTPIGARDAPCGICIALDTLDGRIVDQRVAARMEYQPA